MAIPLALQNSVALVGVLLLQAVVNGLGIAYVAAFGAAIRIFFFMKEPSIAMGHALAAYAGQNTGAGLMLRVREGIRAALCLSLPVCAAAMAAMVFFGQHMASWVLTTQEAQAVGMTALLLRILAGMLPVLYLMYAFRAALQGMGHPLVLMASGGVEMALRSAFALTLPLTLGIVGVGIAETSAWLGAMLLFAFRLWQVLRRRIFRDEPDSH
jgi:Na+-driven multidrug efflux pump